MQKKCVAYTLRIEFKIKGFLLKKKVFDKMKDNILPSYTSNFFLRNVLKKNDSIVKLQDIYGKKATFSNSLNYLENNK